MTFFVVKVHVTTRAEAEALVQHALEGQEGWTVQWTDIEEVDE